MTFLVIDRWPTIPADMPLFMADFVLAEQVLSNLLLNAVLHTPPSTPIRTSIGIDAQLGRVFLAVTDRGPPIALEIRETLFQNFQRGAPTGPGGQDPGFSIVKGYMLAQGGDVSVARELGAGARFSVHLPIHTHDNLPQK